MLALIELLVSVSATSVCSFVSGFAVMHGMIASASTLLRYSLTLSVNEGKIVLGLSMCVAACIAAILVVVGDLCYYSNRDVTYWAYILNSAIPGTGFLIAACLVHTYEVK